MRTDLQATDRQKQQMEVVLKTADYNKRMPLTSREFKKIYGIDAKQHSGLFNTGETFVKTSPMFDSIRRYLGV